MASYKTKYTSKFLRVDDLAGRRRRVTIQQVVEETVGQGADAENKWVVSFVDPVKSLVLNRINADTIAEVAGTDEVDDWRGTVITLYPSKTEFQGRRVPCIRVEGAGESPTPVAAEPEVSVYDSEV